MIKAKERNAVKDAMILLWNSSLKRYFEHHCVHAHVWNEKNNFPTVLQNEAKNRKTLHRNLKICDVRLI